MRVRHPSITMAAKVWRLVAVVLRVAAAAAAGVALIVTATSHQTATVFGFQFEVKFQHTPSLVFFLAANAVACAYSLLVLLVPPASRAARLVLMVDLMVGMVLTGGVGAVGAVADLGKNGNSHAGWLPVCGQIPTFCNRVGGAFVCGSVAVALYFLIVLRSIYTISST